MPCDQPDFQPVYDALAQITGKSDIAQHLLEPADRTRKTDLLLDWAKAQNPDPLFGKSRPAMNSPDYEAASDQSDLTRWN